MKFAKFVNVCFPSAADDMNWSVSHKENAKNFLLLIWYYRYCSSSEITPISELNFQFFFLLRLMFAAA